MTTLTIKLGGSLLQDPQALATLATEIEGLQAKDVRICLVHGGGPQLSAALAEAGVAEQRIDGLRITPPEAARIVQQEMDALGLELAAALTRHGLPAVHVASTSGRLTAEPKVLEDASADLGRVGTVKAFDGLGLPGPVGGPVPVVTPVGVDLEGPLNVNADEGAAAIAAAIGTDTLVLATGVGGVLGPDGTLIERLTPSQARQLVAGGTAHGGMIPKLQAALAALQDGVRDVRITRIETGTLTGLFGAEEAPGTRVSPTVGVPA